VFIHRFFVPVYKLAIFANFQTGFAARLVAGLIAKFVTALVAGFSRRFNRGL
jgi:hypothetical protein